MMYPDTYYSRTLAENRQRPALSTAAVCDTAIVGGGLAGLMTALPLARAGQRVIVLEAKAIGFGASGRNGGFVSPGYSVDGQAITHMAGAETARTLHQMSIEGVECLQDTVAALDIPGVNSTSGIVSVLRYDDGASLVAHAAAMRREFGYELDYRDSGAIRTALKTRRYFHALRDRRAFHLHPLNYLRGVALEIERLGGRIYENSPALQTDISGSKQKILTAAGEVLAQNLVLATGGYTGNLNAPLQRSFLPISTYVMISKVAPELIASAITTTDGIADNRRAGDYYRLVENGRRLLWGGRITTRAADTAGIAEALRREIRGTYPQLLALRTELTWSGLMSYARHGMPQIGKLQPGIWYCTAFGGHGLNTTAIGGKVLAEGILGQSERYQIFQPFGLLWTGGRAGLAVAQLTYWKLQAQDWWRERAG